MGMCSTVLILNDTLDRIRSDPKAWASQLLDALQQGREEELMQGTTVITVDHANTIAVIAVGGNCATVMARLHEEEFTHCNKDGQVSILHRLADRLGFRRLIKKRNIKMGRLLRTALAQFEGTSDWTCSDCSRQHKPTDFHCMCGQCQPNGREYIPILLNALADVYGIKLNPVYEYEYDGDRVISHSKKTEKTRKKDKNA